jgi:hypothetical protein
MPEIDFGLLHPVDVGALTQQGFSTGMAMVKHVQTQNALKAYLANPDDPQAYNALAAFDPQSAGTLQAQRLQQRKLLLDQQDRERAVALGTLATTDPAGAQKEALAAGDFDLADHFEKLDDTSRSKLAAFYKAAAPVAYQMRQIADPEQRKALLAQARPVLEATGVDPKAIDGFDVANNTALDGLITAGSTVDQLIERGKIQWHQQGEQPSFATDYMGRPVGTKNPYAGSGASPPPAAQGGFEAAVTHVLGNEGGYNASDMNGKPVNFGINQGANPDVDVKSLTRDQAIQIYHDRYWVPSGAEKLPANMQAPYFDVYIRNPSVAQRALAASNGDPHKFSEITSAYFQHLGQTPDGQKYAKSWANRDSKNLHIATEGGVGGAVHVESKAEFDKLPSGTPFIAPDGSRRVKP